MSGPYECALCGCPNAGSHVGCNDKARADGYRAGIEAALRVVYEVEAVSRIDTGDDTLLIRDRLRALAALSAPAAPKAPERGACERCYRTGKDLSFFEGQPELAPCPACKGTGGKG